jgi:hypothetical protein
MPNQPPPSSGNVHDYLVYTLSLPERALRTTTGLLGGAVRESADLLVPQAFRDSKCYTSLVQQTLDFLIDDIGGVEKPKEEGANPKIDDYVARKTVGNFVEMASLATLHASPMLLLAIVSDVAYGSRTYLKELADELRREGLIDENSTIDSAGELLDALRDTTGTAASVFDTPPLSIGGMRASIESTIKSAQQLDPTKVLPRAEIEQLWADMRQIADKQDVSLLEVSGAVTLHALDSIASVGSGALSGVRVAGTLLDRHVVDHYRTALGEIHERGYYATLSDASRPYIAAVWQNFSTERPTITGDLLSGKLVGQAASTVGRWLGIGKPLEESELPIDAPKDPITTSGPTQRIDSTSPRPAPSPPDGDATGGGPRPL